MSVIILPKGKIIIGSVDEAFNDEIFTRHQISVYINVADELNISTRVSADGYKFGLHDDCPDEDITRIFNQVFKLIHSYSSRNETVMIHCLEGISRSVAITLAYLVAYHGESPESAYKIIKSHRPNADVYPLYLDQIYQWYNLRT